MYANQINTGYVHVYNKAGSKIRSMKMDSESVDCLRALRFDVNENLYSTSQSYSSIYVSTKEGENVKTIKLCGIGIPDGPLILLMIMEIYMYQMEWFTY